MRLYWIAIRLITGFLLIKMGMETGLWLSTVFGLLVCLFALVEFVERLVSAIEAMRE